jgi:L-alanine-DL-glutamate epimerase-like enolase superfamily enzyme
MRITKIETIPVSLSAVPFNSAYGSFDDYHNVIVKIYADTGEYGVGEASPWLPSEAGATQANVLEMINKHLAPQLIGEDPRSIAKIHSIMDRCASGHPVSKAAIDLALYDLVGKAYGTSVSNLLGGAFRTQFRTTGAIGVKDLDDTVNDAHEWVSNGYQAIKLKVPGITQADPFNAVRTVKALREAIGWDVMLIMDVNQGWISPGIAIPVIRQMDEYDVYCEQPILASDYEGLGEISRAVRTPIIADESVFTIPGMLELIRRRCAPIVNIKVTRPGGLFRARHLVTLATAAGIRCQIDDVAETRITTTAVAHLAASVPEGLYFYYSSGPAHMWLKEDVVGKGGISIDPDGLVHLPTGPGLGLELDDEVVDRNHTKLNG